VDALAENKQSPLMWAVLRGQACLPTCKQGNDLPRQLASKPASKPISPASKSASQQARQEARNPIFAGRQILNEQIACVFCFFLITFVAVTHSEMLDKLGMTIDHLCC